MMFVTMSVKKFRAECYEALESALYLDHASRLATQGIYNKAPWWRRPFLPRSSSRFWMINKVVFHLSEVAIAGEDQMIEVEGTLFHRFNQINGLASNIRIAVEGGAPAPATLKAIQFDLDRINE